MQQFIRERNNTNDIIGILMQIQSRLYTRILEYNILRDDYYKDFKILPYLFIVVNNDTLEPIPLVWEHHDNMFEGDIYYGKQKQILCRDPECLGQELNEYLKNEHIVPIGIEKDSINNLNEKLYNL